MFLGPGCSKAAMPVAEAIHYWNIVQVSSLTCYVESRINHITDILMKPGEVKIKDPDRNNELCSIIGFHQMPGFWRIFYTLLLEINENKPIRNFIWNEGVFLGIVFK